MESFLIRPIKHGSYILDLLKAVYLPQQVAAVHCKAHQKDSQPMVMGLRILQEHPVQGALLPTPNSSLS